MSFLIILLSILLVPVCLLLMGVILIQDSKGGGLTGAFGGAGGTELLGARGQKEFAKFTTILSIIFFVLCISIGLLLKAESGSSVATDEPEAEAESIDPGEPVGGNPLQPGVNLDVTPGGGGTPVQIPGGPPGMGPADGQPAPAGAAQDGAAGGDAGGAASGGDADGAGADGADAEAETDPPGGG